MTSETKECYNDDVTIRSTCDGKQYRTIEQDCNALDVSGTWGRNYCNITNVALDDIDVYHNKTGKIGHCDATTTPISCRQSDDFKEEIITTNGNCDHTFEKCADWAIACKLKKDQSCDPTGDGSECFSHTCTTITLVPPKGKCT
ncbi:MAG TPA: hypothetical protein DHV62_10425 [Elusimicrobia bacterium]|nr:hypothetical protein [Elusimicrobiota bacterium]